MTPDGTKVNGEDVVTPKEKFHEKKWVRIGAVLTALGVVISGVTGLVKALGVDQLILSKSKENAAQVETTYKMLKGNIAAHDTALKDLVARMAEIEKCYAVMDNDVDDLEKDMRMFRWMRLTHGTRESMPPPP